jgi:uncharacterized protein (DUF2336 family)
MTSERAERATREAREKATIIISADAAARGSHGPLALARHLRLNGQLTAGLVLRSLLSGHRALFEAALAELSGLPIGRVSGHVRAWRHSGFAALYARARLPEGLFTAFEAALAAADEAGLSGGDAMLSRTAIERVLTACAEMNSPEIERLLAMLRRLEAEAARDEARIVSSRMAAEEERRSAVPIVIDFEALEAEILQAA